MRCYICDVVIDEPNFNSKHDDFEPCPACMLIIDDLVASFKDRPAVDEDELGPPDPILSYDPFGEDEEETFPL